MFCPRCHTDLKDNTRFCNKCGMDLKKTSNKKQSVHSDTFKVINRYSTYDRQYDYSKKYNEVMNKKSNIKVIKDDKLDQLIINEEYINSYIGNNYEFIKDSSISFFSLIFGSIYLIYRKLTLQGILLLLLHFVIFLILGNIFGFISIIITNLVLLFIFKDLYLKHVEKRVELIKNKNKDKKYKEIIEICKKEGGTISLDKLLLLIMLIIFLIIIVRIASYINTDEKDNNNKKKVKNEIVTIKGMEYKIPNNYSNNDTSSDIYHFYSYHNNKDNCYIHIHTSNKNSTLENYINEQSKYDNYKSSDIKENTYNNNVWKYQELSNDYENKYIYAIENNNIIYDMTFIISKKETKYCEKIKDKVMNSIKIN